MFRLISSSKEQIQTVFNVISQSSIHQMKSKEKHGLECVSTLCLYTSELSCFPKYISDEMAFTSSPNFFRASPVSESAAASGFLLVVGLITVTNKKKKII